MLHPKSLDPKEDVKKKRNNESDEKHRRADRTFRSYRSGSGAGLLVIYKTITIDCLNGELDFINWWTTVRSMAASTRLTLVNKNGVENKSNKIYKIIEKYV
ncbi:uncharacterized protein LOC114240046 [Bombyx mandarina]|uniref:Uncharacterized protein LOC114240046 n=1 Tax=Bombyx mandarina TaxID=7092 RepID=A0A6J2JCQ2_BOMMA|nr:uncharacterized protein LOC114240046 [Bombyx mandarina]